MHNTCFPAALQENLLAIFQKILTPGTRVVTLQGMPTHSFVICSCNSQIWRQDTGQTVCVLLRTLCAYLSFHPKLMIACQMPLIGDPNQYNITCNPPPPPMIINNIFRYKVKGTSDESDDSESAWSESYNKPSLSPEFEQSLDSTNTTKAANEIGPFKNFISGFRNLTFSGLMLNLASILFNSN